MVCLLVSACNRDSAFCMSSFGIQEGEIGEEIFCNPGVQGVGKGGVGSGPKGEFCFSW